MTTDTHEEHLRLHTTLVRAAAENHWMQREARRRRVARIREVAAILGVALVAAAFLAFACVAG